jgi:DNA mismatch repair protein MutS
MAHASLPAAAQATPAMRQYLDAKRQYRDAIVFFRMGDFYEMFYEDALVAARALELALTSRAKDASGAAIPMCGVPFHAADGYIARLVRKGFRVAICEQVEDPRKAKGVVQRAVVRVVSPGTLVDAAHLDAREPAFLLSLVAGDQPRGGTPLAFGAALADLSTGEFTVAEYAGETSVRALAEELALLRPREVITAAVDASPPVASIAGEGVPVTALAPETFSIERAERALCAQLGTSSLEGLGLARRPLATRAAGALVQYLRDTQKAELAHIRSLRYREHSDALLVDGPTLKHLAVVEGAEGTRQGSLLDQIDRTHTAMGGRLLRAWLLRPLARLEPLQDRLDAVEELAFRTSDRGKLRDALKSIHDIERLVSRAALGTAGPRDLTALRQSLAAIPRIRAISTDLQAPLVQSVLAALDDLADVREALAATLVDDPPALARDGGAIRDGVDPELDDLRTVSRSGRAHIAAMEEAERSRTGIGSLKIRFNRVFGYYIEVSKANLRAVPDDYQRKQTIAGGERYVTPALKDYEEKVLGADDRILTREIELFEALRSRVAGAASRLQETARSLATLDALAGFAEVAATCNYTKPQMHDGDELVAYDTRHPIVEQQSREPFVPNDVALDRTACQLVILTGPNMGGKSTYLRQVALLSLMAQAGSFVPARQAKLPVIDRIFARVGASDNIVRGQSTFMVEMQETARILHSATSRSLVVLDEIGRGTATFDGLSIAWAVAEHLARDPRARPKTLFATHYHELTDLAEAVPGVVNAHVEVREWKDDIVFLRKVVSGRSDRSYGIQVARLAGLPPAVVARAREILDGLERDELSRGGRPSLTPTPGDAETRQLGLFQTPALPYQRLIERLTQVDVNQLTPLAALTLIAELQREIRETDA